MPDLSVTVNGLKLPNPFVIGSGPPSTNANVIGRAYDEGWGAVVSKTVCLDASKIINVAPRYARMRTEHSREVVGWQNIELISDRSLEVWEDEFKKIKDQYPDRILIASIMDEYRKDAWFEIVERVQACGVDALELNFSCPHGLPERKMGSAMGQDPEILTDVCSWVSEAARVPFWAKLTPNVTHITDPAHAALAARCNGISAINTILSVMGVDLDTLRPQPTVEGYSTAGGYSGKAVRPIAMRMVMELATMMFGAGGNGVNAGGPSTVDFNKVGASESSTNHGSNGNGQHALSGAFPNATLSAIGGVEAGDHAAQYMLLGAHTVQVCTGVMIHGYKLIHQLCAELDAFMNRHGFKTIEDFRGHSLQYFTSHADLVQRQAEQKEVKTHGGMVTQDAAWESDTFVQQSDRLVGKP